MEHTERDPLGVGPCEDLDVFAAKVSGATIQDLAREAAGYFETAKREDVDDERDATYVRTRDDAPEWITDLVRAAHDDGDILPDDWRYERIRSALDHLAEMDHDPDDFPGEWADDQVDDYTSDALAWLGSHSVRIGYTDQAREDLGDFDSITGQIGAGQYIEAREIWYQVVRFLSERLGA